MKKFTKSLLVTLAMATMVVSPSANAADITPAAQNILSYGSQGSFGGSDEFFTGKVQVDMLFPATSELPASGGYVTFAPGARSAWHTHPVGQTLLVIEGVAWTQEWGKPITEAHVGDVIVCPANIKHWHGASPGSRMKHLALTGTTADGKNVTWLEKVSDEQYNGK